MTLHALQLTITGCAPLFFFIFFYSYLSACLCENLLYEWACVCVCVCTLYVYTSVVAWAFVHTCVCGRVCSLWLLSCMALEPLVTPAHCESFHFQMQIPTVSLVSFWNTNTQNANKTPVAEDLIFFTPLSSNQMKERLQFNLRHTATEGPAESYITINNFTANKQQAEKQCPRRDGERQRTRLRSQSAHCLILKIAQDVGSAWSQSSLHLNH